MPKRRSANVLCACHARIVLPYPPAANSWVQNLPPSAFFAFADIRPALQFRNDPLQVEFANSLKQGFAMLLNVIHVHTARLNHVYQSKATISPSVMERPGGLFTTQLLDQRFT